MLAAGAAVTGLATLAGFLGGLWWRLELFSHFRLQYFLLLSAASLLFLLGKKYPAAALGGVFALANLALIAPFYLRVPSAFAGAQPYRVLLSNVLMENRSYAQVVELVQETRPDLVILLEVNERWLYGVRALEADYPYRKLAPRNDHFGVALYSRLPIDQAEARVFGSLEKPSVVARFTVEGRPLTVIAAHPPPPRTGRMARQRNEQMEAIARFAAKQPGAVILAGDLNASPWSPDMQQWLRTSGLKDSRLGFGLQPTWPTAWPVFLTPIDHVLVSDQVAVQNRQRGPDIGSDHYPVIVDFSLK